MIVLWGMPFSLREFPIYHLPFIYLQMQATLVSAVYLEENGFMGFSIRCFSVVLHCDNSTVFKVINKTSSKDHNLMKLMRRLMILSLKYNIHFPACHFLGVADMLSRLQVVQFKMRFPYMEKDPIPVPQDSLRLWNKPRIFYCAVHCHHHL